MSADETKLNAQEQELCIHCQERPGVTVDHVFAGAFFGKATPKVMMTVPSCKECNSGRGDGGPRDMSLDEEYLRTVCAGSKWAEDHPTARRLIKGEITRSLKNSPKFAGRMLRATRHIEAATTSGIIIPNQIGTILEDDRAARVIRKMVRGLYYTYSNRTWPKPCPLPKDWPITATRIRCEEDFVKFNNMVDSWPLSGPWTSMGDEKAVSYRGSLLSKDSNVSIWLIGFYSAVVFLAHTIPPPGSELAHTEPELAGVW